VNCLLKRASLRVQQGTLDNEAESDFQMAITLDSENPDIYHQRGLVRCTKIDKNNDNIL